MDINSGVCLYSGVDFRESRDFGFNFGVTISFIYFDFSSNLAKGKGYREEYLPENNTMEPNGIHIDAFNMGYNHQLSGRWYIVPFIGMVYTKDIYQNVNGPDTYFYDNGGTDFKFNFGLNAKFFVTDNLGVTAGIGRCELLKAGLVFKFLSSSTLRR